MGAFIWSQKLPKSDAEPSINESDSTGIVTIENNLIYAVLSFYCCAEAINKLSWEYQVRVVEETVRQHQQNKGTEDCMFGKVTGYIPSDL
jgi:hypothetical protein